MLKYGIEFSLHTPVGLLVVFSIVILSGKGYIILWSWSISYQLYTFEKMSLQHELFQHDKFIVAYYNIRCNN